MSPSLLVTYGVSLPPAALDLLAQAGLLPSPPALLAPTMPAAALRPLTPVQGQIWAALTRRALNDRQTALLEIYWRARQAGEAALSVDEAARRLAVALGLNPARAVDYVKGALRSFGRRLFQTLDRPPLRMGRDRDGEGVADGIPLLALLAIETGPTGEARHRLTDDGMTAVAAALGITASGVAAGGVATGDPSLDDPDAVVAMGMTRGTAGLLLRVQRTFALGMDATIKALTAHAGAG